MFLEGDEHEADRTDDKTKSSKNEEIRLRLGSNEQVHGQNHLPQYRLNNASSHKTYKGKQTSVDAESSNFLSEIYFSYIVASKQLILLIILRCQ